MTRPPSALVACKHRIFSALVILLCGFIVYQSAGGSALGQKPSSVDPALTFYSHGDPSPDEQYLLELVNRARANPAAEGQRLAAITDPIIVSAYQYFSVDTGKLKSDFTHYDAKPPLAFNARLMSSARTQALDQAAHGFQGHNGSNGSTFDARITATKYAWVGAGENTYTYVSGPYFGYVGMMTDWGVPSLDHRVNLLDTDPSHIGSKETGISYVPSSVANFGPYVLTQDFATPTVNTAFLQGVVYDDTNTDGFYTQGEGAAGIIVTSLQSGYYTITSASGGYALPLDEINGASLAQVTFDDNHGHHVTKQVTCGNNVTDNIKADLVTALHNGVFSALSVAPVRNASRTTMKPGKLLVVREGTDVSQALTVHYEVSGSAVAGEDYQPLKGWTVIPAGATSVSVKVRPMPALASVAAPEQLTVTLQAVDQDPTMAWGTAEASVMVN